MCEQLGFVPRSRFAEYFSKHLTVLFNIIFFNKKLLPPLRHWWFKGCGTSIAHLRPLLIIIFSPWYYSKMFLTSLNVLITIIVSRPSHSLSIISSSRWSPVVLIIPWSVPKEGQPPWHKEFIGSFFLFPVNPEI